mmetsp:Transcript_7382/g.11810  ORF Transcript_7382/g.11810 Transcript_7382/m.11810 type:complete len:474 (-) Transcript_7382:809-2230(-)
MVHLGAISVACTFLGVAGKAGWNDHNIVSTKSGWQQVDMAEQLGTPNPPYDDRWKRNTSTIIVLVSALRETRLPKTLQSAFDNAAHPDRVRFAVIQQNTEQDDDCIEALCKARGKPLERNGETQDYTNPNNCVEFDKVRVLRMHAKEAKGPVYARGLQETLIQDEDFCMQIDAHTVFKRDWDVLMSQQWGATENEFAVLTTYPTNYKDLYKNSNKHWEMPHICGADMSRSGAISNKQAGAVANLDRPLIGGFWAAGLSFSRCHAEERAPNDPNLKQVFSGEEYSRGARLWTHGYDFYSITRPIIGVYYGSEKGGKGSWKHNHAEQEASMARIRTLLKFPDSDQSEEALRKLGRYGLGDQRSLEQYAEFSGVNTMTLEGSGSCIVKYVPWSDSKLKPAIRERDARLRREYQKATVIAHDDAPIHDLPIVDIHGTPAVTEFHYAVCLFIFIAVILYALRPFIRRTFLKQKGHHAR